MQAAIVRITDYIIVAGVVSLAIIGFLMHQRTTRAELEHQELRIQNAVKLLAKGE